MDPRIERHRLDQVPLFDAFFSYSSKDRKIVEEIARRLAGDGFDVFVDSWFIEPGQHIPKVLLAALRKSRKVVACMTPNYFQSKWAEFELNWNFVETHLIDAGANTPLIPVVLKTCDIPKETKSLRHIDLTGEGWESGYRELAAALSLTESLLVDAYAVPLGSESRYLGDFIAGKMQLLFGFPETRVRDFVTVYGELVQNAFDHVKKKANSVEVSVRAQMSQVVLEVSDTGPGFDLSASLRGARETMASDPHIVGLRGLQLVSHMCDRLSNAVRNRRHVVTALMYREKTTQQVSDLADLLQMEVGPSGSLWGRAARGPWFVEFVDPSGRYACLVIRLTRIDHHNADDVQQFLSGSLQGQSFQKVIVDCSVVEYISSAGLRALMLLAKQVRSNGGTCALIVRSPVVKEILEISRFELIFEVFHSLTQALAGFTEMP